MTCTMPSEALFVLIHTKQVQRLEKNSVYPDLLPESAKSITYKQDKGGTVEYLLSNWVKQLYLEKQKAPVVGNEVAEVVYVWGPRAKLEMGEEGVAAFIAEFYDDWEDREVDRLKLDLARLSGDQV
jgi:hypothetical protein